MQGVGYNTTTAYRVTGFFFNRGGEVGYVTATIDG